MEGDWTKLQSGSRWTLIFNKDVTQFLHVNHGHLSLDNIPSVLKSRLYFPMTGKQTDPIKIEETERNEDKPYYTKIESDK